MNQEFEIVIHLFSALAIGLLIGIERGWSLGDEPEGGRFAGIRTFSLTGLLGGVCAELSSFTGEWLIAIVFGAVAILVIVSYLSGVRKNKDIGTTTSIAMLLAFLLAVWAGFGEYEYALGVTAVVVALLSLKPVLHSWVSNIETKEVYAGVKLLIISAVLLPMLPNQEYGPWDAVNPYWVWWMVVLICGISFMGYFAVKYIGDKMGILITAVTGGLASSTAVTLSLSKIARRHSAQNVFIAGILIATSIMFIRAFAEVMVVNPSLLHPLWIPFAVMFTAVLASGFFLWKLRDSPEEEPSIEIKNPFKITMALKFGVLLVFILIFTRAMEAWFGEQGIYAISVISGMLKVDAIVLSLAKMSANGMAESTAITGIVIAAATNAMAKGAIFSFFAGFRQGLRLILCLLVAVLLGLLSTGLILL